ncbi:hypothetical protein LBMAG53_21680 [Planctomycetota bacterium]|nr:hypothetical protein LBMAG53_21680 [Planctomycetota bacterium]
MYVSHCFTWVYVLTERHWRRRGAVWGKAKRRTRNAVKGLLATAARRKDADAVVELANKLIEALGPEESK